MITIHTHSPAAASPAERRALLPLLEEVRPLVTTTYWNDVHEPERMLSAHLNSTAWVVARDATGELVGTARAISDGAKAAWIYDVVVVEELRSRGIGKRLMDTLLAHPMLRGVRHVHLSTRDADPFYVRLGFGYSDDVCRRPWRRVLMSLDQGRVPFPAWDEDEPGCSPLAS